MHQFVESVEQADEMEALAYHDACGVQIGADSEANTESASRNDAAVCPQIAENADQIFGATVAQVEYENDQCNLFESATPFE